MSGPRVLARYSFGLPKRDPYSSHRTWCEGFGILNVRGGFFRVSPHPPRKAALQALRHGDPLPLFQLTLYSENGEPVAIGDLGARLLRLTEHPLSIGLVLRFVGASESQMELLNDLPARFPEARDDVVAGLMERS